MDTERRARLKFNLAALPRRPSAWIMGAAGTLGYILLHLPPEQMQLLLEHLPVPLPAWAVPIVMTVLGLVAQVWPRKGEPSPDEAAAPADVLPLITKDRSE